MHDLPWKRPADGLRTSESDRPLRRALLPLATTLLALAGTAAGEETRTGEGIPGPPPRFVENSGQWAEGVRFQRGSGPARAWFLDGAYVLDLDDPAPGASRACAVRFRFGEGPPVTPVGEEERPGLSHFLREQRPAGSSGGARSFGRLRYAEAWPGVDLVVRDGDGVFRYDLHLAPGAELERVVLAVEGAERIDLDEDGALRVHTPLGILRHQPPISWSLGEAGERRAVASRFRRIDERRFGFEAPGASPTEPLVIDPGVVWSSLLGDYDQDVVQDVAVVPGGGVVAVGTTTTPTFPITVGVYDASHNGGADVFVTRFVSSGTALVFSTFLGGSGNEYATGVAIAPSGEIWVTGFTDSTDFPTTTGAFDPTYNGGTDGFLARLDGSGATLVSSTFLGGGQGDRPHAVVLDSSSRPLVCGSTSSSSFPTTPGAFDSSFNGGTSGGGDVFVTCLTADATALSFSTFLGSSGNDTALDLAVESSGRVTVCGVTTSSFFPVTSGVVDPTHNAGTSAADGFVTRLEAGGGSLVWSTYLGGTGADSVEGVGIEPGGEAVVVGRTESADYPTTPGAVQTAYGGLGDAFAARLTADASQLVYSTFLGGLESDRALDVAVDGSGQAIVVGGTESSGFPTTPWARDSSFNSPPGLYLADGFVVRLDPAGALSYSGFVGGWEHEEVLAVALFRAEGAVLGGHTTSWNFPVSAGAHDTDYDGSLIPDGFVTRIQFMRHPFNYGDGKPNSASSVAVIGTSGFPSRSAGNFGIWVDGAVPNQWGYIFWSSSPGERPFMGGSLLMRPPISRSPLQHFDWFGSTEISVPIDPTMLGRTTFYQAWFIDPNDSWGIGLSDAVEVTFYP